MLGSRSNRSLSPLPGTTDLPTTSGMAIVAPLRGDTDVLGRSVSDRSTTSSTGYLPMGRMGPLRRQSTHLVPPVVGNFELQSKPSRKVLSTTNSVERLDSLTKREISEDDDGLNAANTTRRRARASSSASSAAGTASASGLHIKLAKLLSRGTGEKASSPSLADSSSSEQAPRRHDDQVGTTNRHDSTLAKGGEADLFMRSRASRGTLASNAEDPPRPGAANRLDQASATDEGLSPTAEYDFDKADWEGDLSDDDDDYGEPVKSAYSRPDLYGSVGSGPRDLDELDRGTWVMNGKGWQHRETTEAAGTVLPSVIPRDANMETNGDLQLDIGAIMPDPGFSSLDVPATIAETDAELDIEHSSAEAAVPHRTGMIEGDRPDGSLSPTSPRRTSRFDPGHATRDGPGSNVRNSSQHRWNDRPRLPSTNEMFDDAEEEDDEEDGLEINIGMKKGRRSSKPLTPATGRRPSLPPV